LTSSISISSRLPKSSLCGKSSGHFWKPATAEESLDGCGQGSGDSRKDFRLWVFGKLLVRTIRRPDSNAELLGDLGPGAALVAQRVNLLSFATICCS
jgi:hypothetical protein